jgi:hypothetical protein
MRKSFWDKRIPTLLGILLITIGVGVTTFLVKQGVLFKSSASITQQPQDVRITNVTDNSFSVSYKTEDSVIGSVNFGKDSALGGSGLDDRDQQTGILTSHKIHNITVRDLTAQTKYYFSITSGQDKYVNGDQPFEITTGPKLLDSPPKQNPMSGKIVLSDGSSPKEAIIYVTADNSQVISTLVKTDGAYILPLNSLRTNDFSSYYNFSANGKVEMLVVGDSLTSNVLFSVNQISPLPTIILSKDYDFRESQSPVATISAALESFPSFSSTSSAPQILTPKKDQEFTDQKPLFKGTGAPGQNVQIIIRSDQPIQATVKADSSGNWSYRPSSNLSPGTHTITVQAKDSSGILKTITQSFIVYASGQQINPAVPSGTPTPTASVTMALSKTPTPTPTKPVSGGITLTPTPTTGIIASGSPTITSTPLVSTKISQAPTSTSKGGLPPTGNPSIITAGIVGAVIILVGGLLFLF